MFNLFLLRLRKIVVLIKNPRLLKYLIKYNIFPSSEHEFILVGHSFNTIVDIGANKGQFAMAARYWAPNAKLYCFEPIPKIANALSSIFKKEPRVTIFPIAIGQKNEKLAMYVSAKDDSSSILPIGAEQIRLFPGTQEKERIEIKVAPLSSLLSPREIIFPALLKIDVQGYEFEVLLGCESLIAFFDYVYCECSFLELYTGQKLVDSISVWLYQHGFRLAGVYNISYAKSGMAIQADFMFERMHEPLID